LNPVAWQAIATALSSEPLDHNGIYIHRDQIKAKLDPLAKPTILFTCFPKSGSTYITKILKEVSGYQMGVLAYAEGANDQQLDPIRLVQHHQVPVIAQHHMRATLANLELMHLFSIKPLVHVRNLFDSVVSYKEFQEVLIDSENPMAHTSNYFRALDEARRFDMVIDLVVPWYIHFFVSWKELERKYSLSLHWSSYESLLEDPQGFLEELLAASDIPFESSGVSEVLKEVSKDSAIRFNKGVAGRGKILLSEEQQLKIRSYASYYPEVDFSLIGI